MHHRVPIYLLAIYVAAVLFPAPAVWLNALDYGGLTSSKALLSILLFLAGTMVRRVVSPTDAVADHESPRFTIWAVMLGLGIAWLLPIVAATCVVFLLRLLFAGLSAEVELAILLIASMPVANSSIAWSQMQNGSVVTSVALLGLSTVIAPFLVPVVVFVNSVSFQVQVPVHASAAWQTEMPLFLISWVFGPLLLGYVVAYRLSAESHLLLFGISKKLSLPLLLALNYLNAAPALPSLFADILGGVQIAVAVTLQLVLSCGLSCGLLIALERFASANSRLGTAQSQHANFQRAGLEHVGNSAWSTSVLIAVLLKNTGAALVFAGMALPHLPLLSLTILATTLGQHLFVSLLSPVRISEKELLENSSKAVSPARPLQRWTS